MKKFTDGQLVLFGFSLPFIAITMILVIASFGYLVRAYTTPPPTPEVVQVEVPVPVQQEIPIEEIVSEVVHQVLAAMPTPEPQASPEVIAISAPAVTPTPIPVEVIQPEACTDAASLAINTPYFKTWDAEVLAEVTVYNMGDCFWTAGSHYIAPFNVQIPEVAPLNYATLQLVIDTTPGISLITPIVMSNLGVALTPLLMTAPEDFKLNYADPVPSVPSGSIVINFPTRDWEGLQFPKWKMIPGLPGWWYIEGGDGTGYNFGSGCRGGG